MAFQFVPNADGSFDEGMKQTNTETGVEYIFTGGAWRPLGPNIEDDFDVLDDRYINSEVNDTMNGRLTFKNEIRLDPVDSGVSRIRVMRANTPNEFHITSHPETGGALSNSKIHIKIKNNAGEEPETVLRWLPEPEADDWAVPRSYLSNYLPLSGGTLTGDLTIEGKRFYVKNNSGDETFRIQENGFCRTSDLFRSERPDGGPALQGRVDGTLNAEIRCDGRATFKTSVKKDGKELATEEYVQANGGTSGAYLPLSGGTLTGTLSGQLIKSTRNSGYAFEVKPDDNTTVALIRSTGTSSFKSVVIDSLMESSTERPFEVKGRLSDGTTISKNFFYMYANANGTPSAINYDGKMDSSKNIVNKDYVDNKMTGGRFYVSSGSLYWEMN